jgi:hypothetical protein
MLSLFSSVRKSFFYIIVYPIVHIVFFLISFVYKHTYIFTCLLLYIYPSVLSCRRINELTHNPFMYITIFCIKYVLLVVNQTERIHSNRINILHSLSTKYLDWLVIPPPSLRLFISLHSFHNYLFRSTIFPVIIFCQVLISLFIRLLNLD